MVQACQLQDLGPPAAPLRVGHIPTDLLTIQKLTPAVLQHLIRVNSMPILDSEAPNCAAAWVPIFLPALYNLKEKPSAIHFLSLRFSSLYH